MTIKTSKMSLSYKSDYLYQKWPKRVPLGVTVTDKNAVSGGGCFPSRC